MDKQELNEMGIDDQKIANAFFDLMWANRDKLTEGEQELISTAYMDIMAVIDQPLEPALASGKGWVVPNV